MVVWRNPALCVGAALAGGCIASFAFLRGFSVVSKFWSKSGDKELRADGLLVVVAMDVELEAIRCLPLKWQMRSLLGGYEIFEACGKNGCWIGVIKSGIGNVRSALATQAAVYHWGKKVEVIVSLGVGGALSPKLQPGNLMVALRVVKHDSLWSRDAAPPSSHPDAITSQLMAPGELWVSNPNRDKVDVGYNIDPNLSGKINSILRQSKLSFCEGTLLSGDEFVASSGRKRQLSSLDGKNGHVLMVDMEAGGIMQAAKKLGIPLLALRTTADRFLAGSGLDISADYLQAKVSAARAASLVVGALSSTILKVG